MLTKEEETLILLAGFIRCMLNHDPKVGSWTNAPHWIVNTSGDVEYLAGVRRLLYGK